VAQERFQDDNIRNSLLGRPELRAHAIVWFWLRAFQTRFACIWQSSRRAADSKLSVIVENHGGLSSNGKWLRSVIQKVDLPNCGTLPDFGNFPPETDRYEAVEMLMPYAKAVSAKSYDFDDKGDETRIDYYRMMKIVLNAGYKGFVGIEYEGGRLSETDGIVATKKLLEKIRRQHTKT